MTSRLLILLTLILVSIPTFTDDELIAELKPIERQFV